MLVLFLCFFFSVLSCGLVICPGQFKTLQHKIVRQVPEVCLFISLERGSEVRLMAFLSMSNYCMWTQNSSSQILFLVLSMQS